MKVTPLDIQKREFTMGFRGYQRSEVDEFLDMAAESMEEALQENLRLRDRLKDLEVRVEEYRSMEKTLERTLLTAQELSDQMRLAAEKERGLKLEAAHVEADRIVAEARRGAEQIESETRNLELQKKKFQAQMKALLEEHRALLEEGTKEENLIAFAQKK